MGLLSASNIAVLSLVQWVRSLGGVGLIAVGIADNSVIPLPGSMDVFTIWLAASNRDLWFYYAAMATLGALIGGYITYAIARQGGKEAVEHRFDKKKAERLFRRFEKRGFWTVAVACMLPPPFPLVPFLVAAGALQYERKKFMAAIALGRGIRFTVVAGLGATYGDAIVGFFRQYYQPALYALIALAAIGGILALYQYRKYRQRRQGAAVQRRPREKAA
ncbi:MAG: VTT domain-containing protein [Acidobacteria bacterium]|nr:VTT domain-containing protein [Acidobacteriota bacterium]